MSSREPRKRRPNLPTFTHVYRSCRSVVHLTAVCWKWGGRALHVGDKVDVRLAAMIPGMKTSKQGEVLALDESGGTATVLLSSGVTKTLPRANVRHPETYSAEGHLCTALLLRDELLGWFGG